MKKNYTLSAGDVQIQDDGYDTVEVIVDDRRYIAKNHPDAIVNGARYYGVREMDDIKHKNREIGCVVGKLNAINLILKDAGAKTYQTLAKKASA